MICFLSPTVNKMCLQSFAFSTLPEPFWICSNMCITHVNTMFVNVKYFRKGFNISLAASSWNFEMCKATVFWHLKAKTVGSKLIHGYHFEFSPFNCEVITLLITKVCNYWQSPSTQMLLNFQAKLCQKLLFVLNMNFFQLLTFW